MSLVTSGLFAWTLSPWLPAGASCATHAQSRIPTCPRSIDSLPSYVVTPGCEALGCGAVGTSVTDDTSGAFWMLADGDPEIGVGTDSGSFPPLGGWLYTYPGYAAFVTTVWTADLRMDSLCPDFSPEPLCIAVLLTDRSPIDGSGVFAMVTDRGDPATGGFDLSQSGDIHLAAVPRPAVVASDSATVCRGSTTSCQSSADCSPDTGCVLRGATRLMLVLPPETAVSGLYADPECAPHDPLMQGYRIHQRTVPEGSAPPEDLAIDAWEPLTGIVPSGEPFDVLIACPHDQDSARFDVYLAASIVFESGFETGYLSLPSTRIECGPDLVGPELPVPRKPGRRDAHRSRSH